jgi:hypothetical protein
LEVFDVTFSALGAFLATDFVAAFGFALLTAALVAVVLVLGSAFVATFDAVFFGATVTFANLTSRYCLDFGNY